MEQIRTENEMEQIRTENEMVQHPGELTIRLAGSGVDRVQSMTIYFKDDDD